MRAQLLCLLIVMPACQTAGTQRNGPDVRSVLDTPVEFAGPRGSMIEASSTSEIRIGLFAPTTGRHPVGLAMFQGAELAISRFNASGGLTGTPLRLVSRWDDDPWRGGSKEMIKLVYEDSVWIVIGSVDGATTHIAEQVVTKAWLPLLSPVSADPTLTYIRVPWIFRLPPDDERQAITLVSEGIIGNSLGDVGLITSTDHDGRVFAEEMREQLAGVAHPPVFHLQLSEATLDIDDVVDRVTSFEPEALVVRLSPEYVVRLLETLDSIGMDMPVLIPWIPGLGRRDIEGLYGGSVYHVAPFSAVDNQEFAEFEREYRERYGGIATPSAAYSYDAVNLFVRCLDRGAPGLNRAGIRDALAAASGYSGVTGPVVWDNAGGSRSRPVLRLIEGATPSP